MLDKLMSGTVGFVKDNLSLIGNSLPVTFINEKFHDMFGGKQSEDISVADAFDNGTTTPLPLPTGSGTDTTPKKKSEYISIFSMIKRAIKREKFPIKRWIMFGIGLFLMLITIFMVTNHMIMLPWGIRLFAALYILNIGLFADFTKMNMIYYILIAYIGLFLYRYYLKTVDPTIKVVPFHGYGFMPLRTSQNGGVVDSVLNFLTPLFYLGTYLKSGATGTDYNALVRSTEDYMKAQKAVIPDYDKLEEQFKLKPMFEIFENHLINMNLPGFMPPPAPVSPDIKGAAAITEKAGMLSRIFGALSLTKKADTVSEVTEAQSVIKNAQKFTALKEPKPTAI